MQTHPRIASIIEADILDFSVTGVPSFDLSALDLPTALDFDLPTNLRLGHLVEKAVSKLIQSSSIFALLHENIQIIEDKKTIGELDFIIENKQTQELVHLELAYKFYLLDPTLSTETIHNWIGPNRNDSLSEKLNKLKTKQFPLLYNDCTKATLHDLQIDTISQALCLMVSLFIPYRFEGNLSSSYQKAIKGYYINFQTFINHHNESKTYYLPAKKEWGIDPEENNNWSDFDTIQKAVGSAMVEKQSPLCWQKCNDTYVAFFIVWW
ncbi:hypothetical protein FFWV33_16295 [Flavobacterium faecale]|uniref:DUF1853 domain-containing protein n=1 Tax=Flavobacterium faecale TaxID=1355330 RepID=A0A2S1LGT6_9FLAO|nr:DUF1853 family protein [Flavobacterium faecale]AWG22975.1 hypothetical protein FFWV33_16295 [Flavobacterium faecale]